MQLRPSYFVPFLSYWLLPKHGHPRPSYSLLSKLFAGGIIIGVALKFLGSIGVDFAMIWLVIVIASIGIYLPVSLFEASRLQSGKLLRRDWSNIKPEHARKIFLIINYHEILALNAGIVVGFLVLGFLVLGFL